MKKLLDHDTNNKSWEVNSDIRLDVTESCSHWKKDKQPLKKIHMMTKDPKQGRARPLNYINRFPLPRPIFTFEVSS